MRVLSHRTSIRVAIMNSNPGVWLVSTDVSKDQRSTPRKLVAVRVQRVIQMINFQSFLGTSNGLTETARRNRRSAEVWCSLLLSGFPKPWWRYSWGQGYIFQRGGSTCRLWALTLQVGMLLLKSKNKKVLRNVRKTDGEKSRILVYDELSSYKFILFVTPPAH